MTSRFVRSLLATIALLFAACSDAGENLAAFEGPKLLLAEAVGMHSVRLRWARADIQGLRSYRIERRTNLNGVFTDLAVIPAPPGDTAVYFDTTVEPEQIYGYRVSALGSAGGTTDFTVTAGVQTPPRPGIDVRITTALPSALLADPDGYLVRIDGATPTVGAVGTGDASTPVVRRFNPLTPGDYTVVLSGVAANCQVPNLDNPVVTADTIRHVTVTDVGVHTIANVSFAVVCRDPTRGTIEVNVAVAGGATNGQSFQVVASGLADDGSLPDDQRAYAQTREVASGGGQATFESVRPGTYDVELRNITSACKVTGQTKRPITLAALDMQHLDYAVECGGTGGGDVDDPTKPFKLRSQWSNPNPAPGAVVALDVSLFLTNNPPFVLGTVDALTGFSSTVLRADSATAAAGFTVTSNGRTPGAVAWNVFASNPAVATGPIPLARLWFTVIGSAGATTRTTTTVSVVADDGGEESDATGPYAARTQPLPEAALTVGTAAGSSNQAPVAAIAGGNPLSAVAGTALAVSAVGSTDPDGSIVSYAWNVPGATPSTESGAEASVTYTTVGSYTLTLTVTDDDGATATASRSVSVSGAGGSNLPPVAVVAGANPIVATAGAAVVLAATGSSDPEGGPLTYQWSLPGGSPSSGTGQSVTTTYATAGSHTATLTVTDNQGATASATRAVSVSPSSTFVTWRTSFGAAAQGVVPMAVTLDLRSDLPDTPGPEQLESFRADSIKWDPALLDYDSTKFAANLSGAATFDPNHPGRLKLQGNAVGEGPAGLVQVATVYFTAQAGSGTTTTVTKLGKVLGTTATGDFDYLPRTTLAEGTYPSPGGGPVSTIGTVSGTVTRSGTGTQSLTGTMVTINPSAAGAPNASEALSGTGASATFSMSVEVGSGTGAGAGTVSLGPLPSGCAATTPPSGIASYTGLVTGGTQIVAFTVTCTGTAPGAGKYLYRSTWGSITSGQVDLVIAVDPSGFDAAEIPGPDGVSGLEAVTTLTGSAAGRVTAVTPLATNGFAPATIGTLPLPSVRWLTNTTQSERTTLADVATLRFTIGAGAPGTVTTATQGLALYNGDGDALPVDDDGNEANGLGNTTVTEATLAVP